MMQRDEGPVLARWLTHYGTVFGPTNLAIIDNGSSDPFTRQLLRMAEDSGVQVLRQYATAQDFLFKGLLVTETIQAIEKAHRYDFVLPVDCDELLAVFRPDRISLARADILEELRGLLGEQRVLRIGMSMFNVPGQAGWFSPHRHFFKGFVAGGQLVALDKGYHAPSTRRGDEYVTTRLTYLHHHNVPLHVLKRNARRKLEEPYASCDDPELLRRYAADPSVPGNHLLHDLLLDQAAYDALYDSELRIMVDEVHGSGALLCAPAGLVRWDAENYLKANLDVRDFTLGPLLHYVECGWREGRRIS